MNESDPSLWWRLLLVANSLSAWIAWRKPSAPVRLAPKLFGVAAWTAVIVAIAISLAPGIRA